ncbi:MAG: hypothetical protein EOP06_00635 [Proteobacteria bacterium]|nr:MAG: hypothetical protein EOP06_00635 [Pseudomonadota bacterium]
MLINSADAIEAADVEGILGTEIAWVGSFDLYSDIYDVYESNMPEIFYKILKEMSLDKESLSRKRNDFFV